MRIAVSADERSSLAQSLLEKLVARGHDPLVHGARAVGEGVLEEILDAWFAAGPSDGGEDRADIAHLGELDAARSA